MKKRTPRKLSLSKETVGTLDLQIATGGLDTGNACWDSRGFTNCTYCNTNTKWDTDCTQI
jgi:hypothetical protein